MNRDNTVASIMTKDAISVRSDTAIDEINTIFEKYKFHHLPVVDRGELKGLISKSDYLKVRHMLAYTWSGQIDINDLYSTLKASDIMTSQPLCIEPSDTIGMAADIFLANVIHALPVVDDNELVGIVTSHDILAYVFHQLRLS
ncbi:MAG: CBS domain-containing protein [Saprospiraceae bacterium]